MQDFGPDLYSCNWHTLGPWLGHLRHQAEKVSFDNVSSSIVYYCYADRDVCAAILHTDSQQEDALPRDAQ